MIMPQIDFQGSISLYPTAKVFFFLFSATYSDKLSIMFLHESLRRSEKFRKMKCIMILKMNG